MIWKKNSLANVHICGQKQSAIVMSTKYMQIEKLEKALVIWAKVYEIAEFLYYFLRRVF